MSRQSNWIRFSLKRQVNASALMLYTGIDGHSDSLP